MIPNGHLVQSGRRALYLGAVLALAACATTAKPEAPITVQKADVVVVASCVPTTFAAEPTYPDTAQALKDAAGPAERYQLLAAGRLLRMQRSGELEAVVKGCR